MSIKTFVWIGIFIGSSAGSWLGAVLGDGSLFSWQSLVGGTLGAFVGIYAGFKLGQYLGTS
jgi:hypothetical protein